MLYIDIKKGKESMKTLKFQQDILGTAACMNRITKDNKGFGELSSNNNSVYDIWFSWIEKWRRKMERDKIMAGLWKQVTKDFG